MGVAYVPVGAPEDIQPGVMTPADLGGRKVLLTRIEGEVVAFAAQCPHAGFDLDTGQLSGQEIRCIGHNYHFDLTNGECVRPKGGPALAVLPTELREGQVCVRLEW